MSKPRAACSHGMPQATQSPPFPPFEDLDALAASDTPSAGSAWWITYQAVEHVFSAIAHSDQRTGAPLPRPLTEILRDIRSITASGSRPFPHDCLLHVAEFVTDSLEHLLDRHRHRVVRSHEQLPFHQLREVDNRSMAWLARQPGRNIREKLSGRTHAMGVKRDFSADTTENRLLRSFAKIFVRRAIHRLSYADAYDAAPDDIKRIRRIEDCVRLCDDRMRRSGLADVPPLTRLQPNNVLLGDPHYSRIFRAWKWLRDDEEALRDSWAATLHRARIVLCWMVASRLATCERVVVPETLGRVRSGRTDDRIFGVELLDSSGDEPSWLPNAPLELLVVPSGSNDAAFRIRLSLEREAVKAHIATLYGDGLLKESSDSALTFKIQSRADHLQPRRGVGVVIAGSAASLRNVDRVYADVAGLVELSSQIAGLIIERCRIDSRMEKTTPVAPNVADNARIGIELSKTSIHANDNYPIPLLVSPWALALDLPEDSGDFEWLDGRVDRECVIGILGHSLWATGDLLDADEQTDAGMLVLASGRIVGNLASELDVPSDARVAYTVPDAVDEFSQRNLRSVFAGAFHRPVPVWRSVAAATALLTSTGERSPRAGESVVIVDTEFSGVSLTVLTARYNEKLARIHPASHGIYWERKPPLHPDEQLEMLGWPHVLRAYARMLVARALGSHARNVQDRIVDHLLRSGQIATLVAQGGSIFVQAVLDTERSSEVIELFDDPEWFDDAVARWTKRIDTSMKSAVATLPKARIVLIGGPCAYSRLSGCEQRTGRIKVFNETKGVGIIVPVGSTDKVYFQAGSWASGRSPRLDDLVEFEIGKGQKGLEATRVRLAHRPNQWLQRQARVTPQQLARGARECLLRFDSETPVWREWLPELYLEVVRDGHFGEIPLLVRGTFVDPFLGESIKFTVPETLTLGRGHRWFSFPLLVGQQDRRPIAWEARLDSSSFPLVSDIRVLLKLAYRYGLDNSYELVVEPELPEGAPFSRIEARWVRGGESMREYGPRDCPHFCVGTWEHRSEERFVEFAKKLIELDESDLERVLAAIHSPSRRNHDELVWQERRARALYGVTKDCWSQGRSAKAAGIDLRNVLPQFCNTLLAASKQFPGAFELLALLHEDAPESVVDRILSADEEAADNRDLYKKTSTMMAMLVGDGVGRRVLLLERLLSRLRRYTEVDTYDLALAGMTMRALGNAAWRHPAFVTALAMYPGAVDQILGQCRRSLQNLLIHIPLSISSEEDRQQFVNRSGSSNLRMVRDAHIVPPEDECKRIVGRVLGTPFRDGCELLLALLRIEPSNLAVALLRSGSASADSLAKVVRQIDARFAALGVAVPWRVQLNVEIPNELHRMSKVAFALNSYMSKGAGTNLVRVTGVDTD